MKENNYTYKKCNLWHIKGSGMSLIANLEHGSPRIVVVGEGRSDGWMDTANKPGTTSGFKEEGWLPHLSMQQMQSFH